MNRARDVLRNVSVRTKDDLAVLQDLPKGRSQVAHGFPITPVFDALSSFTLSWRVGMHQEVSSSVSGIVPLTYDTTTKHDADVVVMRLRQYRATYASDSSDAKDGKTHIQLEAFDFVKRQAKRPDSTFYLSDLFIDNSNGLPSEVRYAGGNEISFVVDYAQIGGYWLVNHAHYEETIFAPLHVGRFHVTADAVYDNFAFPSVAPDPRLAG
jgi:hypothetical protein